MKHKKALSLILAMLMLVSVLAACGGGGDTPDSSDPGDSQQGDSNPSDSQQNSSDSGAQTEGDGILTVGYGTVIDSLTPFRSNTGQDAPYMTLLFESLAVLNADREYEKWAAKDWSTSDNGFTYDVEIYDNISDSAGNKITADDIVWFLEETIKAALKPDFSKIESVTKTGDYTFQVKLKENMVGLFESLMKHTFVISKAAYGASKDGFATECVTTSAYKVTGFEASSHIDFEKRDDYWQDPSLVPDCVVANTPKITFRFITEASQMGTALETGTIDMAIDMPSTTAVQYLENSEYTSWESPNMQGWTLFFSGADSRPVANDVKLRQAICYAIDPQGLISAIAAGHGSPMYDVCPPTAIGYNPKWDSEEYYPYSEEDAKAALEESDYAGQTLEILCSSSNQRMAEIIQGYLGAVGIKVELKALDMAQLTAIRLDGTQYDMFINTIGATTLANHWSIRYDPNAYATGDGTSRHDYTLGEMLYETWSLDGWTEENIDKVHYYLRDNAIAYGLFNPQRFTLWRTDVGMEDTVYEYAGWPSVAATTFTNA